MDDTQNAAEVFRATSVDIGELVNVAGASGISLDGCDPAAFFTDGQSKHGDLNISAMHKGVTYFFASKDHKRKFESRICVLVNHYSMGVSIEYDLLKGQVFPSFQNL